MWLENVLSEGEHAQRLRTDLSYFAEHALKLRPKAGPLEPFVFNAAQLKLHEVIEAQKAKAGRVRVVVLKARQLGMSTYVAARLYHRTINNPGLRTIIIGHERRASSNLFDIVKRFHANMPDDLRPSIGVSNREELIFDRIDWGYLVSVASGEGTGRSATAQLLHASEAAFWDDLPLQMASLMQTVPDLTALRSSWKARPADIMTFTSYGARPRPATVISCQCSCPGQSTPTIGDELPDFTMDADERSLPSCTAWTLNRLRGDDRRSDS